MHIASFEDVLCRLPSLIVWALVQIDNAYTRLSATYLEKDDLDAGRGGVATSQDLARLVIGAYYSIRLARKHERHQQLSPTLHQAGVVTVLWGSGTVDPFQQLASDSCGPCNQRSFTLS